MRIFFLSICLIFIHCTHAQKLTSFFGKVSQEELSMTSYAPDTSAAAVILYQSGYFNNLDLSYTFVRRVKVLKKEGVRYAEYTFRSDENTSVRGKVYNLVNGKVVEEKLKAESIFKEKYMEDEYRYKIAMPNVQVGSVFEISYSQFLLPQSFNFQEFIPVVKSELLIESHHQIEYRMNQMGYLPVKNYGNGFYSAENIPAFKVEDFTDSHENYISKVEFDIQRISVPNYYRAFTTTWEAVNERLRASLYFGGTITSSSSYLNDWANEINTANAEVEGKIKAAFDKVKNVKWNREERLYATVNSLGTQFKKQSGNSAEINMILYQLMQKLNIPCSPLVLSTRANGVLNPFYPTLYKLDYTAVCVHLNGKDLILDASEQYMPMGLLPMRCLNGQGRLIDNGSGRWVTITPEKKEKEIVNYQLKVRPDFNLDVKQTRNLFDYAAFDFRELYAQFPGKESFIEAFEKVHDGWQVEEMDIVNLDSIYLPCQIKSTYVIEGKSQFVNDMLVVYPLLDNQMLTNSFKEESRNYPINYGYLREKVITVSIEIPSGFQVGSIPEALRLRSEDRGINVVVNTLQTGNTVVTTYKFNINKIMFLPEEYTILREFYTQIARKQSEPIVFKRVSDVAMQ